MQTISCKSLPRVGHRSAGDAHNQGSIIRVPFTGSVKLRSLLLKSGPGEQTPAKVALVRYSNPVYTTTKKKQHAPLLSLMSKPQFANIDNLDFSDAQDKEPLQQFDVAVGREVGEYTLK